MRFRGALGQHRHIDAQGQQRLAQVVVDVARDALALFFLDLFPVRGQFAQSRARPT